MMDDDQQTEIILALQHQAAAAGLGPARAIHAGVNYAQSAQSGIEDVHIRSSALQSAIQLSKPGDAFPDVIGRARMIYEFLTAGRAP